MFLEIARITDVADKVIQIIFVDFKFFWFDINKINICQAFLPYDFKEFGFAKRTLVNLIRPVFEAIETKEMSKLKMITLWQNITKCPEGIRAFTGKSRNLRRVFDWHSS